MTGLLTAREVADLLAVSAETVLRWHRRGEFAGLVVRLPGGAIRFPEDKLAVWLEGRAVGAPASETRPTTPRR